VLVLLDGGQGLPVAVTPSMTPQVPANGSIPVEHMGSISLAPAPCGHCGEDVGIAMAVTSSAGAQRSYATSTRLTCDGGI
jgi:hypothetical protein